LVLAKDKVTHRPISALHLQFFRSAKGLKQPAFQRFWSKLTARSTLGKRQHTACEKVGNYSFCRLSCGCDFTVHAVYVIEISQGSASAAETTLERPHSSSHRPL